MTIPHCEDRTVYCTLPPESIFGGEVTIDYNPSPKFFNNPKKECRWTKWLNTGKDSKGDREKIADIFSQFSWQACPNPEDINVRIVGTEDILPKTEGSVQMVVEFKSVVGGIY